MRPENITSIDLSSALKFAKQAYQFLAEVGEIIGKALNFLASSNDVSKNEIRELTCKAKREVIKKYIKSINDLRSTVSGHAFDDLLKQLKQWETISDNLLNLMKKAKPHETKGHTSWRAKIKNVWQKCEFQKLEFELSDCQEKLGHQVLSTILPLLMEHGDMINNVKDEVLSVRQYLKTDLKPTMKAAHCDLLKHIDELVRTQGELLSRNGHQRIMDSLRFDKMNDRYKNVHHPSKGTFGWIFDNSNDAEFGWLFDDNNSDDEGSGPGGSRPGHIGNGQESSVRKDAIHKFMHWLFHRW